MDHNEVIDKGVDILQKFLGDEDVFDEIWDLLEQNNYVVQDNDDDYDRADKFFGFLISELARRTPESDPFT